MAFSNTVIVEPTPGKPHIVYIDGYWRVSPWKKRTGELYIKAHRFINRLNSQLSLSKYANKES